MKKSKRKHIKKKQHLIETSVKVNREYRSAVFKMYFSIKKNALDLYNALNGTDYKDEDQLVINSLENSIYLKIYNDVSFIISETVNLYEHQSTSNPNMPLRDLFYITEMYKRMIPKDDLYGAKLITVPTPHFIVFYNGTADISDKQVLKLSDAFIRKTDDPELELKVKVLNVNYGHNKELMDKCIPLKDYAILTERVRDNVRNGMAIEEAAAKAVDSCIADHIMEDFLLKERIGVIQMHVLDFNEKLHNQSLREEGYEAGLEAGINSAQTKIIRFMLDNGKDPREISSLCNIPLEQITKVQTSQTC